MTNPTAKQIKGWAKAKETRKAKLEAKGEVQSMVEEQPIVEEVQEENPNEKPITRQNKNSWHCPWDDHAMEIKLNRCAKCGARREGNLAVKE